MAETFLENVKLKIGTETQFQEKLKDLPIGTLVGTTDPIDEGDLSTDVINKLAAGANALPKPTNDTTGSTGQVLKKTDSGSEWADSAEGVAVTLSGTSGTVTTTQLATLQANDNNYIVCDNEIFRLSSKDSSGLKYTLNGYVETKLLFQRKVLEISLNSLSWLIAIESADVVTLSSETSGTLTAEQFASVQKDNTVIVWNYTTLQTRVFQKNATIYSTSNVISSIQYSWKTSLPALGDYAYNITIGADKTYTITRLDNDGVSYYRHNVRLTVATGTVYYEYISTSSTKASLSTIKFMNSSEMIPLTVLVNGLYATVNGLVYLGSSGTTINVIAHGVYVTSATAFAYLNITGETATIADDIVTKIE